MRPRQVRIFQCTTFMVSGLAGDVRRETRVPSGLFYRDMRHLSHWELRIDGHGPEAVSGAAVETDEALFFLAEPVATIDDTPTYAIIRRRQIAGGMCERLELTNHDLDPLPVQVTVLFGADFADVFEIDEDARKVGRLYSRIDGDRVTLGYQRGDFRRETQIHAPSAFLTRKLRGALAVDEHCRIVDGPWALGDGTGVALFTHVAMYQARVVADTILGRPRRADYTAVPRVVFAQPEIAAVGLTTAQAHDRGIDIAGTEVDLAEAITRPWTYQTHPTGTLGLLADRHRRVLIGAWDIAPQAGEWIHQAALAIRVGIPIDTLRDGIAQYPTFSEAYTTATEQLDL